MGHGSQVRAMTDAPDDRRAASGGPAAPPEGVDEEVAADEAAAEEDAAEEDPVVEGDETAVSIAFVCVRNAGRSQMAAAFARREVAERDLDVRIVTGGTDPAEAVHDTVLAAMREVGVDLSGREPQSVTSPELAECDVVVTMGCSALDLEPAVDVREWALADPRDADLVEVRAIRDEIEARVEELFEELETRSTDRG